ncbi:hypothetical protein MGAST_01340 [Mycobacterium gastri 'Wayne']|uniref:Uncharacterized protein n=1 Tax=Mycobacterium gastri TaxID=1777 RepID=A0A1X1VXB7_MYCGS|nr:hypothetical protein MGAST_01340 [Mycobacterium gastri 'Wayne']ORV74250.1 hypothetical protein AWC07_25450 [Mycobacterium gastri]
MGGAVFGAFGGHPVDAVLGEWRTMPTVIWDVRQPVARVALWAVFWLGWAIVFASTFMINHFDLVGLRQVYLAWRGFRL